MSKRNAINTDKIYVPRVPLSCAAKIGNVVYVSGITPFTKDRELAPTFAGQMHEVMKGLTIVLEEAGSSLERVAKVNVILVSLSDFAEMNEIYKQYFKPPYPARTTIESKITYKEGLRLEIECVAECDA